MSANTVQLHRIFKSSAERVYRAFTTPAAFAKWLPPHGFTATVHEMDSRVGGGYRMSFTNLTTGASHSFGGEYLELAPGKRVRYTAAFEDPQLPGRMQTTVDLRELSCGVEVRIVQEGIPEMIPLESCYLGWQESLELLGKLVEPEIK
ncbi:SRPBCC family protein [Massilia sp. IC2-477]|uniref:SRPBCC family protein n=1 Tax=unclassified Massilia TaxID=2609279 RepID=UPI001D0FB299|nr:MULTISPECIES: SRPBCC family protein [unclassified Massilia]MCC2955457.1 SRPBCC family protein [Massilia sp. IC2-477]MCC2974516.1 SRPBCC family protein [Massilia sp. IC2-476]